MDDLIAFIRARLDEDEATARAACDAPRLPWQDDEWGDQPEAWIAHYARHDPARALREVAAKRAILTRHAPHQPAFGDVACNWCSDDVDDRPQLMKVRWPCPDVRTLAAVWSDHPDYRDHWTP